MRLTAISGLLSVAMAMLLPGIAMAELQWNFKPANTSVGHAVYDLHMLAMIIIAVIFVGVSGFMFYAIFRHRKSLGHEAAHFHQNAMVEVVWTIVPVLIIIGMAWPATRTLLEVRDTSAPDMTIKATGFQWKWGYEYIDDGVKFYSSLSTPRDQIEGSAEKGENYLLEVDAPMVVPVGKKVRMLITSNDVLHSWYVPELAVNQDAIPGLIRDAWFRADTTGIFRGQCAKLCGRDHGFMPIVVKVLSEDDYKIWLAGQKASVGITAFDPDKEYSISELSPIGEAVYSAHCTTCHKADGKGSPPLFPAVSGGTISTGPVADHVDMVLNGSKKNPMMAAWRFQLSDMEIAAVVTYERNALGNAVGDVAQPGDVAAARDQTASK